MRSSYASEALTTVRQGTSVIVMVSRTEALCHQVKTHEPTRRAQLHTLPNSVRGLRLRSAVRSRQVAHWTSYPGSHLTVRASLKWRQHHRVSGRLRQLSRGGGDSRLSKENQNMNDGKQKHMKKWTEDQARKMNNKRDDFLFQKEHTQKNKTQKKQTGTNNKPKKLQEKET